MNTNSLEVISSENPEVTPTEEQPQKRGRGRPKGSIKFPENYLPNGKYKSYRPIDPDYFIKRYHLLGNVKTECSRCGSTVSLNKIQRHMATSICARRTQKRELDKYFKLFMEKMLNGEFPSLLNEN